ncbi:unnamed protein product [Peronospora farinosa]|uniref:Uncharacterized protein n=1 Tax=Peronospora farinosa TaxID=134698 RepID=A0AAV0STY0_9STRA|nr:unnamed protein product [Peronospora farinosa]
MAYAQAFYMINVPPAIAGDTFDIFFCGVTLVQRDANGEILFLHRNIRRLTSELKRRTVSLRTIAALRAKQNLALARSRGRINLTIEEISEKFRNNGATLSPMLDAPEADGYPDAIY